MVGLGVFDIGAKRKQPKREEEEKKRGRSPLVGAASPATIKPTGGKVGVPPSNTNPELPPTTSTMTGKLPRKVPTKAVKGRQAAIFQSHLRPAQGAAGHTITSFGSLSDPTTTHRPEEPPDAGKSLRKAPPERCSSRSTAIITASVRSTHAAAGLTTSSTWSPLSPTAILGQVPPKSVTVITRKR